MQNNRKKDMILDAMQRLMNRSSAQSISVSDVAKEAGIGKGSIYYYFKSKEEILEAVIERSYSAAIAKAKNLLETPDMEALTKMEIIFRTCRESSMELLRQESNNFFELQQSALLHQQYIRIMGEKSAPYPGRHYPPGQPRGVYALQIPGGGIGDRAYHPYHQTGQSPHKRQPGAHPKDTGCIFLYAGNQFSY